ncbi:MAG TPA: sce7726 family protein [Noviherbaspirillum sp.]|uniref:sce7726 family protein n=1 Tax=Noviherbaspirillum sp. TaxID=1926288 RepID=UPI002B4AA4D4|nr:sce7726 family protein [Noviherbaspirillum sp.]HJV87905.1 sce7726 family protein [Noviherbaspirillum sp.]
MSKNCAISPNTVPVTEVEIRTALLTAIKRKRSTRQQIQEEFRIERGGARIDVAVIGKSMIGYEIKSDLDTFARFSNQIHAYNRVFDQIYLVCGPSHANAALSIVPVWWGVLVAERSAKGKISLEVMRDAQSNLRQDPFSLASLLWKEEALAVIRQSDHIQLPKAASSHILWESIASALTLDAVKTLVSTALLQRQVSKASAVKTI